MVDGHNIGARNQHADSGAYEFHIHRAYIIYGVLNLKGGSVPEPMGIPLPTPLQAGLCVCVWCMCVCVCDIIVIIVILSCIYHDEDIFIIAQHCF